MFIIDPEGLLIPSLLEIHLKKHFPSRCGVRVKCIGLSVTIWKELCNLRLFKRKCLFEALRNVSCVNELLKVNYWIQQKEMSSNQSFMPLAWVSKWETKVPKLSGIKSHCSAVRLCDWFHKLITYLTQASIILLFRNIQGVGRNLSLVSLGFMMD